MVQNRLLLVISYHIEIVMDMVNLLARKKNYTNHLGSFILFHYSRRRLFIFISDTFFSGFNFETKIIRTEKLLFLLLSRCFFFDGQWWWPYFSSWSSSSSSKKSRKKKRSRLVTCVKREIINIFEKKMKIVLLLDHISSQKVRALNIVLCVYTCISADSVYN